MFASNCKSFLKFSFVDFHYFNHYSVCFFFCFASCAPLLVRFVFCMLFYHFSPSLSVACCFCCQSSWCCHESIVFILTVPIYKKNEDGREILSRFNMYGWLQAKCILSSRNKTLSYIHKWTCSTSTSTNTTIITLTHTHRRAHKVLMTETLCSH